ncbi:MAG TPA: beta galactosidase jelly roll domain-containing protein, partial [Methanomicrobiales archaeon]|nr:beta galactosidase jelly roll domain-containing protein [Methanomicrobiales archaeon]
LPYTFASTSTFGRQSISFDADSGDLSASAIVRNAESTARTIDVPLRIGGETVDSTQVSLQPGEKTSVSFTRTLSGAGVYSVAIDDLQPKVFTLPHISLAGQWQFHEGDNDAWKRPSYDDSAWQTVTLPAHWEDTSNYTKNQVYGWYRKTFSIPDAWSGYDLKLPMGKIDDVDETFLNGTKIGQTGTFPKNGYETAWSQERIYTAPANVVNFGGENTVAVRVYDGGGGGGLYDGLLGPISAVLD